MHYLNKAIYENQCINVNAWYLCANDQTCPSGTSPLLETRYL